MMNKDIHNEILIVEDDAIAQLIIQHNLKLFFPNHSFKTAFNGQDALQHIEKNLAKLPCAITLDLNMPTMNGFQFVETLIKQNINIPVFVVSSSTLSDDIQKCKNFSTIHSFYSKPFLKSSAEDIYRIITQLKNK